MRVFALACVSAFLLSACGSRDADAPNPAPETETVEACVTPDDLRLNDIQAVGSHNSYKQLIPAAELGVIAMSSKEAAAALDYGHIPLTEQLDLGLRQIELDVVYDPEGGRYADPMLPRLSAGQPGVPVYDASKMSAPGFKVLHVQDLDVRATCQVFTDCLTEIADWSAEHPGHTPILILINAKQDAIDVPGSVTPLPFDAAAFEALDDEIIWTLAEAKRVTPDEVRGGAPTLREGVLADGWPMLKYARGGIIVALDEAPEVVETYMRGRSSLEGLPLFVKSIGLDEDHAAYFTMNDPIADAGMIAAAVEAGFLVRTRADADTVEARSGDTTRRDAAFASGAQYVSTDYYLPRPEFSDYSVSLPGTEQVRCNPLRTGEACKVCPN